MKEVKSYLRQEKKGLLILALFTGIFALVFFLAGMPLRVVGYGFLLCLFLLLVFYFIGFTQYLRWYRQLGRVSEEMILTLERLPLPESAMEELYQEMLRKMRAEYSGQLQEIISERQEESEYFTIWTHQIKTPISAIRLLLQTEEGCNPELESELFKIEQYVQMLLNSQRLRDMESDWVLRQQKLDPMIRQSIRKYAKQFIRKKLHLQYDGTDITVLTDEKWLCFVIEQILSNALKYSPHGEISIKTQGNSLVISDTGIGIAAEDLPRIFEKGYTGFNGRAEKKSTGVGLYLCRKICDKLGHRISIQSRIGEGTEVFLDFSDDLALRQD